MLKCFQTWRESLFSALPYIYDEAFLQKPLAINYFHEESPR